MTTLTDPDKKLNVITHFNKLFSIRHEDPTEEDTIPEEEQKGYMDPANVCCVIPLKKSFKEALIKNFDVSGNYGDIPSLDYNRRTGQGTKYSTAYLKIMLELTRHYESIRIYSADDYPLTFEVEDFKIILAPRV